MDVRDNKKLAILTKSRCKSLDLVSKYSLLSTPSLIFKMLHGILNDPGLDAFEFHISLNLEKLPLKMQFTINDQFQLHHYNYCWAFNLFRYCKNKIKCTNLHDCPNCNVDHPVIQCNKTPYWIKQKMSKWNYQNIKAAKASNKQSNSNVTDNDNVNA